MSQSRFLSLLLSPTSCCFRVGPRNQLAKQSVVVAPAERPSCGGLVATLLVMLARVGISRTFRFQVYVPRYRCKLSNLSCRLTYRWEGRGLIYSSLHTVPVKLGLSFN